MPFRPNYQDQLMLLPPNLEDLIPEKDLVRVVDGFVRSLPRSAVEEPLEKERGRPAHHPRAMLKVLLYAYTAKVYSSRKIARALRQNVFFMWLAGMERPDHTTVNRFRGIYLNACLGEVFSELIGFLLTEGYVEGKDYFVDGTMLEADARKHHVVWRKNTQRYAARVRERVAEILREVERVNREEDEYYGDRDLEETGEGSDVTAEQIEEAARRVGEQLEKKRRQEDRTKQRGRARQARKLREEAKKLRRYEEQEATLGERNSYSRTDPDATFMRMKNGELRGGYNLQIGTENGFILAHSLSQSPNDAACLKEHLEARQRQGQKKAPKRLIADAGYGTEENYDLLEQEKIEAYVKYASWYREVKGKTKPFEKAAFEYDASRDEFICPAGRRLVRTGQQELTRQSGFVTEEHQYACPDCSGCQWKARCTQSEANRTLRRLPRLERYQKKVRKRLSSEEGIAYRKRRGWEVETPFAMMKKNLGFVRVHLRGIAKAGLEITYLMTAMNLMRLAKMGAATA